jgi:hypothetical protein
VRSPALAHAHPRRPRPVPQTGKLSNLPNIVAAGRKHGLPVRVTEAATLSYGGVQGISDTAGAAIWALDAALEAAAAGASGIHFHQVHCASAELGRGGSRLPGCLWWARDTSCPLGAAAPGTWALKPQRRCPVTAPSPQI